MHQTLSDESKKSFNTLMITWFAIAASLLLYLVLCYALFITEAFKPFYTLEALQANLFSGMTLHSALYLVAAMIFIGSDAHAKYAYKKLLQEASSQNFKTKDDEFNFFRTKYASIMFVHTAIFNLIAILGVIVFLMTFDFTTLMNLIIIALLGFVLMLPSRAKLTFPAQKACPLKK